MPQFKTLFRWLVPIFVAALLLLIIPFSEQEVATQRLDQPLNQELEIQKEIALNCKELLPIENSTLERWFISKLWTPNAIKNSTDLPSCTLKAQSAHASSLHLLAQWSLGFEVWSNSTQKVLLGKTFSTSFPLPLCFLPLLAFIFFLPSSTAIVVSCLALLSYFLFLTGLSPIQLFKILPKTALSMVTTDRLFPGFLIFSLWLALKPVSERNRVRLASNKLEMLLNSALTHLLGVWNPFLYSLMSPLFFPLGREFKKLRYFFNSQILILALSLYLFGIEITHLSASLSYLITPRYLSLSILFYYLLNLLPSHPAHQPLLWEFQNAGKYAGWIVVTEILALLIPSVRFVPRLTRIGLVFLLVDLSQINLDGLKAIFQRWQFPLMALLISAGIGSLTAEVGALDLVISICDPKKHPNALLSFTLLSGFLIGLLTGGLTSPFFVLVSQMMQNYSAPLLRAALFDGVLLGVMFSPFSLFNLYPALQHGISLQRLLKLRARQLWVPLLMGLVIYFVGTVSVIGILPPACFVFGCLTVITFKLRQLNWKLGRFGSIERSAQH
jgi:hypothetical protein